MPVNIITIPNRKTVNACQRKDQHERCRDVI